MNNRICIAAKRGMSVAMAAAALMCGVAKAETLKIGVIAALSGPGAAWGQAAAEATRIAAQEANAAGGLDVGGKKYQVEVIAYDDQYKTAEAVSAYNRLVNQDGVKFVVIMSSAGTMALKQSVEDDKVLALTSAATSKALDKNSKFLFRMYSSPRQYFGPIAAWLKNNTKGRVVVTVNPNDETGWDTTEVSEEAFKANGFEVRDKELSERAQKDFQPMLTKVIAMRPDVIELGATSPATAGLIIRQARELGYDKLFSKMGGSSPREIVAAAGAKSAEGMINMLYADPANEGYKRLAAAYKKNRGQDGNEIMIVFYDGARVLLNAIQKAGTISDMTKVAAAFGKALPMKSIEGDEMRLGGMKLYGSNSEVITVNYIGAIRNGETVVMGKTN